MHRSYVLPDDVDVKTLSSHLTEKGLGTAVRGRTLREDVCDCIAANVSHTSRPSIANDAAKHMTNENSSFMKGSIHLYKYCE